MSMDTLTILQTIEVFCAYMFATVALPAFVMRKKLADHRLTERFVIYFMTGNFYIMNLVFCLQLLKISYPVTLAVGTFVPVTAAWIKVNHIPVRRFTEEKLELLKRLNQGSLGFRTARKRLYGALGKKLAAFGRFVSRLLLKRPFDCLLTLFLLILLWWLYGQNLLYAYGYKASDIPVHNYWINAMGENHIFVAGVYPHGFHAVIYYLHALFGIETYVLLRVFAFVENVMVHLMLLCFLKLCCKTRFAAYAGTLLYAGGSFWAANTYTRLYSTLPQEFGMIFIFPAIYFGFAYFEVRRREIKEEQKGRWRESYLYLAGFAMSFSMTLAVHFYGTMIAGIFCIAMAVGYAFLLFRKKYFWDVFLTCAISVLIAVLPMALAFLGGTPLQGSLKWGMNVIKQSQETQPAAQEGSGQGQEQTGSVQEESGLVQKQGSQASAQEDSSQTAGGQELRQGSKTQPAQSLQPEEESRTDWKQRLLMLKDGLRTRVNRGWQAIQRAFAASVFRLKDQKNIYWIMNSFLVLIALGLILFLFKEQRCYACTLISCGLYLLFMGVIMAPKAFGLPAIMDANRGSIYTAYSLPIAAALAVDGALQLLFLPVKRKFLMHACSLAWVMLAGWYIYENDYIKQPRNTGALEMNEAIVCVANILETEEDFTWTIVSANDELRMTTDYGYHYETITFLEDMEWEGADAFIRIPTSSVYFFIEKVPLDYMVQYEGSGQSISREGAAMPLPPSVGIRMYQGEQRWILMSKMYYWAQEFQRLYPNEMDVYLETDQFICYRIEQNPYRLYNFAIDYGFNTQQTGEAAKEEIYGIP